MPEKYNEVKEVNPKEATIGITMRFQKEKQEKEKKEDVNRRA